MYRFCHSKVSFYSIISDHANTVLRKTGRIELCFADNLQISALTYISWKKFVTIYKNN